jgi:hypothetical protein
MDKSQQFMLNEGSHAQKILFIPCSGKGRDCQRLGVRKEIDNKGV